MGTSRCSTGQPQGMYETGEGVPRPTRVRGGLGSDAPGLGNEWHVMNVCQGMVPDPVKN